MLTESFLVSTAAPDKVSNTISSKDIGIHHYRFLPITAVEATYKKSSTQPNCLAVNATHIFAAQAEKAVLHVYNKESGSQEAVVPFPEIIHSVVLYGDADGGGVLVLGTQNGRVILWELCTGRQVSTPQSHLHPTSCLALDQTSNFLLSGSPDSNIHLWSIPSLLSFLNSSIHDADQLQPLSPLKSLLNHRATITALKFGHSSSLANIAISASQDKTCIVWDYISGIALHTFLLPSAPLCLSLDPADRAAYVGYDDGSIQLINFYTEQSFTHPLQQSSLHSTPSQPPPTDRWLLPSSEPSAALSLQLSYDGANLLSGHRNGAIQTWDVAKGRFVATLADLSAPVTNLKMLSPTGFPISSNPSLKAHKVIKPRYESSLGASNNLSIASGVPSNYTFTAQFTSTLPISSPVPSNFSAALTSPTFPTSLLDASIAELTSLRSAIEDPTSNTTQDDPGEQNIHLLAQLNAALHTQRDAMSQLLEMDRKCWRMQEEQRIKSERKRRRRERRREDEERRRIAAGAIVEETSAFLQQRKRGEVRNTAENSRRENDVAMNELEKEEEGELSSSTDEMTESD